MHVLGLVHEHQSPRSARYVARCAAGQCTPNDYNCEVRGGTTFTVNNFDFRSIMMYSLGNPNGCDLAPTSDGLALMAQQGISRSGVGNVQTWSDGDLGAVATLYDDAFPQNLCSEPQQVKRCNSSVCVAASRLGDGKCDADLKCYDNDGGDCGKTGHHRHDDDDALMDATAWVFVMSGGLLLCIVLIIGVSYCEKSQRRHGYAEMSDKRAPSKFQF